MNVAFSLPGTAHLRPLAALRRSPTISPLYRRIGTENALCGSAQAQRKAHKLSGVTPKSLDSHSIMPLVVSDNHSSNSFWQLIAGLGGAGVHLTGGLELG